MTDRQVTTTTGQGSGTGRPVKRHLMVIATLAVAVLFQLALMASYTGAYARPVLHHVTIRAGGIITDTGRRRQPLSANAVSYQTFPDAATARQEVSDGRLPAALIVAGSHQTLMVAGSGGLTLAAAVEQVATAQAAAAHATLAVQDVRPLPPGDPKGFASYLLFIGWIIGGDLGMTLLTRVLGPRARGRRGTATLTAWTAVYAVASAGLGVVLMDPLMGTLTDHPWALLGAGALIVFAAAMSTAALMSLFGSPASWSPSWPSSCSATRPRAARCLSRCSRAATSSWRRSPQQRRRRPRPQDRVLRRGPARPPARGPRPVRRHRHGGLLRPGAAPLTARARPAAGRVMSRANPGAQPAAVGTPGARGLPRSAEAEEAILRTALEILDDVGDGSFSIEAVAARAGVRAAHHLPALAFQAGAGHRGRYPPGPAPAGHRHRRPAGGLPPPRHRAPARHEQLGGRTAIIAMASDPEVHGGLARHLDERYLRPRRASVDLLRRAADAWRSAPTSTSNCSSTWWWAPRSTAGWRPASPSTARRPGRSSIRSWTSQHHVRDRDPLRSRVPVPPDCPRRPLGPAHDHVNSAAYLLLNFHEKRNPRDHTPLRARSSDSAAARGG